MSVNPFDGFSEIDRVSIRAVLVKAGEDPSAALAEAGFADPVAIPVVLGEDGNLTDGILGNGTTPNLIGILETEHEPEWDQDVSPKGMARSAQPPGTNGAADHATAGPYTTGTGTTRTGTSVTMLPDAFGLQPLAPVRGPGA